MFEDWLKRSRPQHLSTNTGAGEIAFQGWRRFKEAFAPELVGQAFEETSRVLGRRVRTCIDPFGGSGTTALACQFLGVHPTTIEVNPYLADLIEAKLSRYCVDTLIEDFVRVIEALPTTTEPIFRGAPRTFVEPGADGRFLFHADVAGRLSSLYQSIAKLDNPINRRLLRVLLGAIALPVSNVVVSGKGRRYRRGWRSREVAPDQVDTLFSDAVTRAIYDISRFQSGKCEEYSLIRGDCRNDWPVNQIFDLAVLSPPYPNSFDYTDVYNVELWVCGYLKSSDDNKSLRMSTLRSHVQINRPYNSRPLRSSTLRKVNKNLQQVRTKLWNRHIPDMVAAYFTDMADVLAELRRNLTQKGRAYIVIGDSQYAGVQVPVATILREIAIDMGFEITAEEPFRSMRASPQQGGKPELVETLIILGC